MFTSNTRIAFATAAISLAAYPLLRPWSAESDPQTFAGTLWPLSHLLAMVGFVAIAMGLRASVGVESPSWAGQPIRRAESRAWLAVGGLLPYYGAEAFGLHAVGAYAVAHGDARVLAIADDFRYAPLAMACFVAGLLALAMVGGRLIHGTWAAGGTTRLGGVLAGGAMLAYLPQFFTPGPVRIAHGLVLAAGLLLLARAGANRVDGAASGMETPSAQRKASVAH